MSSRASGRQCRHDGVSCDNCGENNFTGDRYKCLVCFDFDLCHACHALGTRPTDEVEHQPDHAMQLILTAADFGASPSPRAMAECPGVTYGSEASSSSMRCLVLTCPVCGSGGHQLHALYEHARRLHPANHEAVICPACAVSPSGEQNYRTNDLPSHLQAQHLSEQRSAGGRRRPPTEATLYSEVAGAARTRTTARHGIHQRMAAMRDRRFTGNNVAVGGLSHFSRTPGTIVTRRAAPPPRGRRAPSETHSDSINLLQMLQSMQNGEGAELYDPFPSLDATPPSVGQALQSAGFGALDFIDGTDTQEEDDDDDAETIEAVRLLQHGATEQAANQAPSTLATRLAMGSTHQQRQHLVNYVMQRRAGANAAAAPVAALPAYRNPMLLHANASWTDDDLPLTGDDDDVGSRTTHDSDAMRLPSEMPADYYASFVPLADVDNVAQLLERLKTMDDREMTRLFDRHES